MSGASQNWNSFATCLLPPCGGLVQRAPRGQGCPQSLPGCQRQLVSLGASSQPGVWSEPCCKVCGGGAAAGKCQGPAGRGRGRPGGHGLLLNLLRCQLRTVAPPGPIPLRGRLGTLDQLAVSTSGDGRQRSKAPREGVGGREGAGCSGCCLVPGSACSVPGDLQAPLLVSITEPARGG